LLKVVSLNIATSTNWRWILEKKARSCWWTYFRTRKGLGSEIAFTAFLESSKISKDLKLVAKKFNSLKKEVITEYKKRALNPKSEINKKINKLFFLSIKIKDDNEILEKAYF